MRPHVTLAQLEAVLAVAERGNFREAARALHVSQPALSRTVRLAEQALGARLFDRDTRHVALTPAGAQLVPIARRLLGEFRGAFGDLAGFLAGRSGEVTVGALPSVAAAVVPQAMAAFRASHPQVRLSLLELPAGPLLEAVIQGQVDLAVTVRPEPDARLHFQPVLDDPFVLVCRPDGAHARAVSLPWKAFESAPFVAAFAGSSIRAVTDAVIVQRGLRLRVEGVYPSVAAAGAMVQAGLGQTALPRLALHLAAASGLVAVPLRQPAMSRSLGLVTRVGRTLSPVSLAFAPLLAQTLGQGGRRV